MTDLSPEELTAVAQRVGRSAARVLVAMQSDTGTPVLMLRPTLEVLAETAGALAGGPDGLVVTYDPERDAAAVKLLSDIPTYIPRSPAELDSDFSPADRQELSGLLNKFLISDVFPGHPVDLTPGTLSAAVNQVIDHLEGVQR